MSLEYHDTVWGTPSFDETFLFEMLSLSAFQAGLNWWIVYKKLPAFRKAFYKFEIDALVYCDDKWIETTAQNSDIIRNRIKISAIIWNAKRAAETRGSDSSFADFLWSAVDHRPVFEPYIPGSEFPATSPYGDALSKLLKSRSFKFCGPTICHAFMQSVGMIVQHSKDCFRYKEIENEFR